jgi:hypothetical protein
MNRFYNKKYFVCSYSGKGMKSRGFKGLAKLRKMKQKTKQKAEINPSSCDNPGCGCGN